MSYKERARFYAIRSALAFGIWFLILIPNMIAGEVLLNHTLSVVVAWSSMVIGSILLGLTSANIYQHFRGDQNTESSSK